MTRTKVLPPAVFLMGPTASGKTDLAIALAERLPLDLISVDSALIYRGMDIGTAKPSPQVLARAPHRLIDIRDPAESYSAAQFRDDALREMERIVLAGRVPLLVGGTMLYFRALERGLSTLPSADERVRSRIDAEARERGWKAMHRRLARVDPGSAERIHPNDPQRLQRALEIYEITGRPMSELLRRTHGSSFPYRVVKLAVVPQRDELRRRIEQRFRAMLEQGFLAEVEALRARGDLRSDRPAMRCVGYRQAWACLAGELSYEGMVEQAITATRQLAKRQLTWLRAEPDVEWFDAQAPDLLEKVLKYLERSTIKG